MSSTVLWQKELQVWQFQRHMNGILDTLICQAGLQICQLLHVILDIIYIYRGSPVEEG